AIPVLRILHDLFERAWFRRGFAIGCQAFKMQRESFCAHVAGFIESLAGADHAGKVRKRYAVVAAGLFMDQGDVLSHFLFTPLLLAGRTAGPFSHLVYFSFRPACFSMLLNVPGGISLRG